MTAQSICSDIDQEAGREGREGMESMAVEHHLISSPPRWDPHFPDRSPMFEPLRAVAAELRGMKWPTLAHLRQQVAARPEPILTAGGRVLSFVAQGGKPRRPRERYEARIFSRGEVQMRQANWHDLLNALVWLTFPRAKAALNARHYQALRQQAGGGNRGPVQDALTLFDEGGVIVAACDARLLELVQAFQWKELFWRNRLQAVSRMRFFLFGHALYEKALAPFSGITGRAVLLEVRPELLGAPTGAQIGELDRMVARHLMDPHRLRSTRDLAPLPILGVPGWCVDNENASYYDDTGYFRPGRLKPR
jgi:hypothetical protein